MPGYNGEILTGSVSSLRKVTAADAGDIIALRNDPAINKYLSSTAAISIEQQMNWIRNNDQRNDNYYWMIVSKDGKSVGTISLYEMTGKRAEFGRYICLNPMNAIDSELILLDFAFNTLALDAVYCRTVLDNVKVWKQHNKMGFTDTGIEDNKSINKVLKVQEIKREQYRRFDYSAFVNMLKRFA